MTENNLALIDSLALARKVDSWDFMASWAVEKGNKCRFTGTLDKLTFELEQTQSYTPPGKEKQVNYILRVSYLSEKAGFVPEEKIELAKLEDNFQIKTFYDRLHSKLPTVGAGNCTIILKEKPTDKKEEGLRYASRFL